MTVPAQRLLSHSALVSRVRSVIESAVERNPADSILLSGGLDTSIVAASASRFRPLSAYTVALTGAPSPDIEYARLMAKHLGLKHELYVFGFNELISTLPELIKTLRVFDPMEIRNSAAVYLAMTLAKKDGASAFLTGDGCDELFAGYSFLFNLDPLALKSALKKLWNVMSFSAIPLGRSLGMTAMIPFLEQEVRDMAGQIDPSLLVGERDGERLGKWIVRVAFEDLLPTEITWRVKTPIEYGCGTTILPQIFDQRVSDTEFLEKKRRIAQTDGVAIRDKEQLAYYEVFREVTGERPGTEERTCPQCQYEVRDDTTFCRTCGAYPI